MDDKFLKEQLQKAEIKQKPHEYQQIMRRAKKSDVMRNFNFLAVPIVVALASIFLMVKAPDTQNKTTDNVIVDPMSALNFLEDSEEKVISDYMDFVDSI